MQSRHLLHLCFGDWVTLFKIHQQQIYYLPINFSTLPHVRGIRLNGNKKEKKAFRMWKINVDTAHNFYKSD